MWPQNYTPIGNSLLWSSLVAALPIAVLLFAITLWKAAAWKASLFGLVASAIVAVAAYHMPVGLMVNAACMGGAFGAFPIFWIIYWAIVLYRLTIETGQFEILKNSIGHLTNHKSLQALLIAFAFGAFLEGAAGFGAPVAVAAAILAGLGFPPFYAAAICLLANTAPVAFGSIGIPLVTLAGTTGLPLQHLSSDVGRIVAPVSLFIPSYLVLVMGGLKALRRVWPAAAITGLSFASVQFLVSNFIGPQLTDILASLAAILSLVVLLRLWKPAEETVTIDQQSQTQSPQIRHTRAEIIRAWSPYLLLIVFVLLWSIEPVKRILNMVTFSFGWPYLHNAVLQIPPVTGAPKPYAAVYAVNWLSASGTSCMLAVLFSCVALRYSPMRLLRLCLSTARQLALAFVSFIAVLALAFLMNYCGATATLGLAFSHAGRAFPFFSAILGWLGVFLTGSDTSANALFGNLQRITATSLGLNPALMAASNSAGGVMGKMISLQSIAVASAATGMPSSDESKLFRFTLRHSIFLAVIIGVIVVVYSYVVPNWAR